MRLFYRGVFLKAKAFTEHASCHVTCGQGSKITTYLKFSWPYCPFTISLQLLGLRWRLGAVYRWNFYTGAFLAENFKVRFWVQFSTLGGFFRGYILTKIFTLKGHTLTWAFCYLIRRIVPAWGGIYTAQCPRVAECVCLHCNCVLWFAIRRWRWCR